MIDTLEETLGVMLVQRMSRLRLRPEGECMLGRGARITLSKAFVIFR